ncbi:hypothetical protein EI171_35665 [Bradyrhizobium sp. LCT2]|uniref:hypothetical protein n=1 Tax=Bradyrhizobium sp. LCT2 TaxID=2493093 RepID=UPI0013744872|nr:hypothetical protein [Bradyrhizobium sp. LCT2]QHP72175.1 hypothetical protein EI171_35665 [Bradyrhizobium sp. LCT2]
METLEIELPALRARAEMLSNRRAAADAAFVEAKAKLQRHHLEADNDADDRARAKLEAAVAACALTRDGYADALKGVQTKIADTEQKLVAERAAAQRKAASDELARKLDQVERALPDYLNAGRRLADTLEAIHHHFETAQVATFVRNGQAQLEVAVAFAAQDIRGMVRAIQDGAAPIPAANPGATLNSTPEPAPPTMTVFMLRSAHYRDQDGRKRFAGQWEDATMPVATAQHALRLGVAVAVTDPSRARLRGARGGDFSPQAPDVLDLDAMEEPKSVPPVEPDPVLREAGFIEIDRSAEARTIQISVPRL